MFNPINAQQQEELRALIAAHDLEAIEERVLGLAQNAIALEPAPEQDGAAQIVGGSRLGGLPDVPPGWDWPPDLMFLGQFNLAEIAPHDHNHLLPSQGVLSFFHHSDSWDESNPGLLCRVFHFETAELARAKAPRGYLPVALSQAGDGREVLHARPVVPRSVISLPTTYSRGWREICAPDDDSGNDLTDAYLALVDELQRELRGDRHQLLGHHAFMDGDADEEAWLAYNKAQHSRSQIEADPQLQQQIGTWTLLFQMDSDNNVGVMFNDAGFAYFMIDKADLQGARFDHIYASLWSS